MYCIIKKNMILFIMFISFFSFSGISFAIKWSDLDSSQKSEIIQYADTQNENDIVEVCKYIQKGLRVNFPRDDVQERYFFIYTDNTATVGWDASGTENTNNESTGYGKAIDGYRETLGGTLYRGVRNWSANKGKNNGNDGVVVSSSDSKDAYSTYKSSSKCPAYIAERENGYSHFFWVSVGSSVGSYDNMIKWINDDKKDFGTVNKYYFNVPLSENDLNLSSNFECVYGEEGSDKPAFSFSLNTFEPTDLNLDSDYAKSKDYEISGVYFNSSMFSTVFLQELEKDKCPKAITGCQNYTVDTPSASYELEITGDVSPSVNENFCKDGRFQRQKQINFTCMGDDDVCSSKPVCKVTSELSGEMQDLLIKYKGTSTNSSEARDILNQYNRVKDKYNTICASILKYRNYSVGTCIDECLKLPEIIAELETDNGLRSTYGNEKCNIGEQVVAMVYNVLKWAKYIAPILVIILTILDFIKALAAQSDDDMKKAQGKFIKRLIVAALLFLLPLIINFTLKTFGFYSSSCDITDLF